MKNSVNYLALFALLTFTLGVKAANPGNPAEFEAQADVEIVELIEITEDQNLDFGRVAKPSSGSTNFTVSTDGSILAAGSDGQALSGHQPGQYDVVGTDSEPYTLTVAPMGGCSDGGLTLSAMTVDAGGGEVASGGGVASALDDLDVLVGGTLEVSSTATDGAQTCGYQVMAQYS